MRQLLLYTFFLSFLQITYGNITVSNFYEFDLLRKIDTSISKINIFNVGSNNDSVLTNIIKYDNLGRLNTIIFLKNGKQVETLTNITFFENTDFIISKKTTTYIAGKPSILTTAYEYDSLLRKTFSYEFNEDTSKVTTQQFFYNSLNLYKINYKSENKSDFYTKYIFFHDTQNRLIKRDCYNRDKKLLYSETEEYTNNTSKEFLVNQEGKELKSIKEYEGNKLIKKITPSNNITVGETESNGTLWTKEKIKFYKYADNGNLIQIDIFIENNLVNKLVLKYINK